MEKKLFSLFVIGTVVCLIFLINWSQDIYPVEEKKIAVKKTDNRLIIAHREIFGKLERPQVVFDHGLHSDKFKKEGCNTCHPLTAEGNFIFDFPFKIVTRNKESIMDSYHEKCIKCHKKMIKEGKKSGPVKCGNCHVKEIESLKIKYPVFEFDFAYHDKHVKKLKEKIGKDDCSLCHHIYDIEEENEELALVYEKGTEESCYYCHELGKKRGPELTAITKVAAKKGLSIRKASHRQCLNCHLRYAGEKEKAGPIVCSKCHTGKYKTVAELKKVPRPDRDQPGKTFITIDDGRMKEVSFDHKLHQINDKTCRSCHHETLKACKTCHTLKGRPEGNRINVANAYHNTFAEQSCAGCHNIKKSERDCSGCHHHLLDMDLQTKGPKKAICSVCHTGKKEGLLPGKPVAVAELTAQKVPEKVTIKVLEHEYEPATFPHLKMIKKLVGISNESKMAVSFHRNLQIICRGCHHQSDTEAEAKKSKPPFCSNCHSVTFDSQNINRPRLLAAYHRQCMGCHEKMNLIKPKECMDCHKEKTARPIDILSKTMDGQSQKVPSGG